MLEWMKAKLLTQTIMNIIFALTFIILIIADISAYQQIQHLQIANNWVSHSKQLIGLFNQTLSLLETKQGSNKVNNNIRLATTLTRDNAQQQMILNEVAALITSQISLSPEKIATIKTLLENAKDNEVYLLQQRTAKLSTETRTSKIIWFVASALGLLVFLINVILLNYYLMKRQKLEAKIKRTEKYQTAILNATSDSIIIIDMNGKIISCNLQSEKIFKYTASELPENNINLLIPDLTQQLPELLNQDSFEKMGRSKLNDILELEINVSLIMVDVHEYYAIFIRDISERKKYYNTILRQQEMIRALSTPILQITSSLLILPIIGELDKSRAKQLTEQLLHEIRNKRAKVVIIDITGVMMVDSYVAGHLLQTVTAARLLGATAIISGISTHIVTSLITLGIDLNNIITVGDLQDGIEMGMHIIKKKHAIRQEIV